MSRGGADGFRASAGSMGLGVVWGLNFDSGAGLVGVGVGLGFGGISIRLILQIPLQSAYIWGDSSVGVTDCPDGICDINEKCKC